MRRRDPRSPRKTRTTTFVSLTGPAGNIGDALIRRETLTWATATSDQLVAYVGEAPDVWLDQLGLQSGTQVLRSKRSVPRWLWLLLTAPRGPVLIFEAGEIPLDRGNMLRELVFLAETVIVRLKGGVVVRPPRGIRAPALPELAVHKGAARLSQVTLWRDATSLTMAGHGILAPDIGFAAGAQEGVPWAHRTELLVSLRGSRSMPDAEWVRAVRDAAQRAGLGIRTVVQVREDEDRARELAALLGGTFEAWGDRDAVRQEENLRQRYGTAQLVISDRMHVLVLAALGGAIPVELVPHPTRKIADAFAAIGLDAVSLDSSVSNPERMVEFLLPTEERASDVTAQVQVAQATLARIQESIRVGIRRVRA